MDVKPQIFSWSVDAEKWLKRFKIISEIKEWDKSKQSLMIPLLFDDVVFEE